MYTGSTEALSDGLPYIGGEEELALVADSGDGDIVVNAYSGGGPTDASGVGTPDLGKTTSWLCENSCRTSSTRSGRRRVVVLIRISQSSDESWKHRCSLFLRMYRKNIAIRSTEGTMEPTAKKLGSLK